MLTLIYPCLISESSCIRDEPLEITSVGVTIPKKKIPARETCLKKKILRIVISKKKIIAEEA